MVEKKRVNTPMGQVDAEVDSPIEGANCPKGPCPIIGGPCVMNTDRCGFWVDIFGVKQSVLGTQKIVVTGNCIFFATFNAATNPRIVAMPPGTSPPNHGGRVSPS